MPHPPSAIELITFDCAQTLVEVNWTLDGFARDCVHELGLDLSNDACSRLVQLYVQFLPEYFQINQRQDPAEAERFWQGLTRMWFSEYGIAETWVQASRDMSEQLMYDPKGVYFKLYPDTEKCLDTLIASGYRLAIISNWDYTLHRILDTLGIRDRFELILASLEQGVEKPDARLFEICLSRLGVAADRTLHVGDDPVDDIQGALKAGIRPVLLRRPGSSPLVGVPNPDEGGLRGVRNASTATSPKPETTPTAIPQHAPAGTPFADLSDPPRASNRKSLARHLLPSPPPYRSKEERDPERGHARRTPKDAVPLISSLSQLTEVLRSIG